MQPLGYMGGHFAFGSSPPSAVPSGPRGEKERDMDAVMPRDGKGRSERVRVGMLPGLADARPGPAARRATKGRAAEGRGEEPLMAGLSRKRAE
jgi:hypothetical protein